MARRACGQLLGLTLGLALVSTLNGAKEPSIALRAGSREHREKNPLFLFHAVLTGTVDGDRVQDVLRNVPVDQQTERICRAWQLARESCTWLEGQLEYSVKREIDAHHVSLRAISPEGVFLTRVLKLGRVTPG